MGVFGSIMSAIFGQSAGAPAGSQGAAPGAAPSSRTAAGETPSIAPSGTPTSAKQAVDVEAVLTGLAAQKKEKLNWRTSIVDLMKLLDLDSSLTARKELADELGYKGDKGDSATMNIWLHKQVMQKLAENGGKVPADLRS